MIKIPPTDTDYKPKLTQPSVLFCFESVTGSVVGCEKQFGVNLESKVCNQKNKHDHS